MSETNVLDFSSMETPVIEPEPVETPVETSSEPPPEETPSPEETPGGGAPEKPPEGKAPPLKAIRDAVKAFETANPELGKHLKQLLDNEGRIRAYQETYPDVETARTVKAAIEAAGGLEGIAELSKLRDTVEETDAMIESGDPEVIERIFSDSKDGPIKLLPHFMNRVEKENAEAFGNALRPHLVRSLAASNFEGVLVALAKATAETPEAKEIVDSIVNWYTDQKRLAEKSNLDSLEPERKKLQEQASTLSQREYKQFENEVNIEVKPHINKTFGTQMRSYLEHDTRPDQAKKDIASAWLRELGKALEKDQKQIEAMMKSKSRNKDAIANYAKTRISAVAEGVTKKIVEQYKLTPGKKTTTTTTKKEGAEEVLTGTGSAPGSPIRVKEKPKDEEIDWEADPDRMNFITGKAKLLHGSKRWVKWR